MSSAGAPSSNSADTPSWSHLPSDIQRHLEWIAENVTHVHYGIAQETDHFFGSLLLQVALQDEALLNAVVAFASYLTTVRNPDGDLADFLRYHHRSITLLLEHFRRGEKDEISTLLTILQLAQIEEYLGDWANVSGHQKAAFQVFNALFEPANVSRTFMGRMCFTWYARFDAYISAVANTPSDLDRSWFDHMEKYYQIQRTLHPDDSRCALAHAYIRVRQLRWRQSRLFAKRRLQCHMGSSFDQGHEALRQDLIRYRQEWPAAIARPEDLESRFGGREPTLDELFQILEGGVIPELPTVEVTELYASWHMTMILHLIASPRMPSEELMSSVRKHAYTIIYYHEAMRRQSPQSLRIGLQSMVQIACSVLRKDDRRIAMWVRRNLAEAEQMG
jgi:hemoglobin-like flavoprotein